MSETRKTYRTNAYRVPKDGQEHIIFWNLTPSGLDPTKYWVTEFDVHGIVVASKPIAGQMPEQEALCRIAELEREAEAKYPLADDHYLQKHPHVGERTWEAASWRQHPLQDEAKQEVLQRLRAKRPPGLKFRL